jgi:ectoine hydroxylase-related dioxygenase (phytanoyl-CoA dioxygenase family)
MLPDCLTQDVINNFQRDGVAIIPAAFTPEWIETLRRGLAKNISNPGPYRREYTVDGKPGHFFGDYCNWSRIAEYEDFARNSLAADIAGALMGSSKVNLFHEHVLVKEPSTQDRTPWHHDQPYYCVSGNDNVSLWIPLDPVPREGAIEFIRGSHKWGRWFTPTKFSGVNYERNDDEFVDLPNIESERDKYDIVSFGLKPGDCAAFHFRTVHGAPGNASTDTRRRAISFR